MKKRKFFAAIAGAVMCLSMISVSVSADNGNTGELSELCENVNTVTEADEAMQEVGSYSDITYSAENLQGGSVNADCIAEEYANGNISVYGANSAPVAGLTYMIANGDTLVNGKISTETIIFWMWNDGENIYSYDPDGGMITNYYVRGINSYIIGNVTIGDDIVGFATKVTQAGPHELQFQVSDSEGNLSNIVSYSFTVEPADGSARPVCRLTASNTSPYAGTYVLFDWSGSTVGSGSTLSSVSVRVTDRYNSSSAASTSDYLVASSDTAMLLTFNEAGTYDVSFSVSDSRDAWSDWTTCTVDVKGSANRIIELNCPEWSDSYTISWTEGVYPDKHTARHVLYARLYNVKVIGGGVKLKSYTNWHGTYNYVIAYQVAPGTYFESADRYFNTKNPYEDNDIIGPYHDHVFGRRTPWSFTDDDILYLLTYGNGNYIDSAAVIFDPISGEIVDFNCPVNLIINNHFSEPTYVKANK
ncbi:MAG: hypothetical protein K2K57_14975 [Oscillospiraceae bacterium]|nr:hypothetical protein [Oscillospiraceae bacterium]